MYDASYEPTPDEKIKNGIIAQIEEVVQLHEEVITNSYLSKTGRVLNAKFCSATLALYEQLEPHIIQYIRMNQDKQSEEGKNDLENVQRLAEDGRNALDNFDRFDIKKAANLLGWLMFFAMMHGLTDTKRPSRVRL